MGGSYGPHTRGGLPRPPEGFFGGWPLGPLDIDPGMGLWHQYGISRVDWVSDPFLTHPLGGPQALEGDRRALWDRRQCHRRAPAGLFRALCPPLGGTAGAKGAVWARGGHRVYTNRHEVGVGVPWPPVGCRLLAQGVPASGGKICPRERMSGNSPWGAPSGSPQKGSKKGIKKISRCRAIFWVRGAVKIRPRERKGERKHPPW